MYINLVSRQIYTSIYIYCPLRRDYHIHENSSVQFIQTVENSEIRVGIGSFELAETFRGILGPDIRHVIKRLVSVCTRNRLTPVIG